MNNKNNGISFLGVLAIVFITLKLLGHITWEWIWVLCPLWIPLAIAIIIGIIIIIIAIMGILLDNLR